MQDTNNSTDSSSDSSSDSNSDPDAAKNLGILSVIQSVIAAMFGVRDHEKHKKLKNVPAPPVVKSPALKASDSSA